MYVSIYNLPGVRMSRFFAALFFLFPMSLFAQTEWSRTTGSLSVGLEGLFPSIKSFGDNRIYGFAVLGQARFPVAAATIVLEIPFAHGGQEYSSSFTNFSRSTSTIGNLYAGLDFAGSSVLSSEVGLRLPLMSVANLVAASAAVSADFLHVERFLAKTASIEGSLKLDPDIAEIVQLHFSLGPIAWIPVPSEGRDIEALLDYEGGASVQAGNVSVAVGMTGRYILTESTLLGDETTVNVLQAEVGARFGLLRTSLYYRRYINPKEFDSRFHSIIGAVIQTGI